LREMAADRRERLAQPSFLVEDGDDDAQHVRLGSEWGGGESGRARQRTRFRHLSAEAELLGLNEAGHRHHRAARPFVRVGAALALMAALFRGRALVGEVFVSTETVARDVDPWRGLAPPPPVHNPYLADQPTVWLPMQWLTRRIVRDGESPLYTNESYAGA